MKPHSRHETAVSQLSLLVGKLHGPQSLVESLNLSAKFLLEKYSFIMRKRLSIPPVGPFCLIMEAQGT